MKKIHVGGASFLFFVRRQHRQVISFSPFHYPLIVSIVLVVNGSYTKPRTRSILSCFIKSHLNVRIAMRFEGRGHFFFKFLLLLSETAIILELSLRAISLDIPPSTLGMFQMSCQNDKISHNLVFLKWEVKFHYG